MCRLETQRRLRQAKLVASALALAGCSAGSGGGDVARSMHSAQAATSRPQIGAADAVRLAKQASFGPTPALIAQIEALGSADAWLSQQMGSAASGYADLSSRIVSTEYCKSFSGVAASNCRRDYFSQTPVAMEFYTHALTAPDQLRQRVAFALSQLLVASDVSVHSTAGLATLNQIFLDNAFGNYRTILKSVTLNPFMGAFLNMANSSKAAPNENYAREFMQLFSIGVVLLNANGTPQRDAAGATLASYTADDVHNVARALTGWTYARLPGAAASSDSQLDFSKPMVIDAGAYDATGKRFLGRDVPAGATQAESLDAVVDAVFSHPNIAPFVSASLIKQLVTSNPSPAYVGRVAAVFLDDGAHVRGNLAAVVRAVLTDADARGAASTAANPGKVKEPVLLMTAIGRLIGDATDGYAFAARDAALGEQPFRSPSVFNFYPPDYPLPLGGGLLSPPGKLLTTATAIARHNLVYDWTLAGDASSRGEYKPQATITGSTGTIPDWTFWTAFGADTDSMLSAIDLLMLNATMTATQRSALKSAVLAVTNADAATQARKRAQTALYIVGTSPQFQIDR